MGEITWLIRHIVNRIYLWMLLFLCGFFMLLLKDEASMKMITTYPVMWIWAAIALILSQIQAKFDIEPADIQACEISAYRAKRALYHKTKKRKVITAMVGFEWFILAVQLFTIQHLDGKMIGNIPGAQADAWIAFPVRIRYFGLYAFGIAVIAMLFQYYMTLIIDTIEGIFYTKRARYSQNILELFVAELFHCFHWFMMLFTVIMVSGVFGYFPYNETIAAFVNAHIHLSIRFIVILLLVTRILTTFICNCRNDRNTHKVLSIVLIPELILSSTCLLLSICRIENAVMDAKLILLVFTFVFIITFLFGILPEIRYRKRTY